VNAPARAAWYAARLRAMGPHEVAVRTQRAVRVRLEDLEWRHAHAAWARRWSPSDLARLQPDLRGPLGVLDASRAAAYAEASPAAAAAVVARADDVLVGRRSLLGYPPVVLDAGAPWARDPFTGATWPDRHGKLLDYRRADVGDPKVVWEINRCQELPLLALAWRLTGDDRYGEHAMTRMLSWIGESAPGRGIAWSNGFEPGLRAISFALTLDALRGSRLVGEAEARRVLTALWQHGRFVEGDLSPTSSANNHLVGELAGLATIGLLAPELPDAARFLRRGLAGLAVEAERQVLPDGGGAEQAHAYHLFVLDLMLLVAALCGRRGVALPAAVDSAFARASTALALLVVGDEPEPAYGDADDGRAFLFDADEARSTSAVVAALRARAGVRTGDPVAALLFGVQPDGARAAESSGSGFLAATGLVVLRRGGDRLLVDAGPLGYLSIAAHGHADALQVTLADDAGDLVVDPGTGSYFGNRAFRTAFRGTRFHATVTVDGLDQAEQAGPFMWRRHYRCSIARVDAEAGIVVAEHDGYRRLEDPVRHRRAVLALDDGLFLVYDLLEASMTHSFTQTWPLAPTLDAVLAAPVVTAAGGEGARLAVVLAATAPAQVTLERGRLDPPDGWVSHRLEQTRPAWTARQHVRAESAGIAALLATGALAEAPPTLAVERDGARARVAVGGRSVELDLDTATVELGSGAAAS
jgi:hypothetical protein